MEFLVYLSSYMIPIILFVIAGVALLNREEGFRLFTSGAKEGMVTVQSILPTLIGLMVGTGILRASGALDGLALMITPLLTKVHFSAALVPMILVKMISSSAATTLLLDIYKVYGPDSYEGFLASVIMSSTETIFYTLAVYFAVIKVSKTRYTICGALIATLSGIFMAAILCETMK